MREHEVPTHVQAEDKILLGFTFPQIVAVTAVCAISYGAYRYAPVGPSEVRMALAVVLGLAGVAMVVGQIGGRRLPLVAADLLKYRLGARLFAGPPAQLTRNEPPAPVQPVNSGPGPLRLMVRKARRGLRRPRKKGRKDGERRNGRMRWFGKRRGKDGGNRQRHDHRAETLERGSRKPRGGWAAFVALAVLMAAVVAVPQSALADGHEDGGWSSDEIEFQPPQPVEGRRLFVERLSVTGDRAAVTLRAATALDLRFWGSASLVEGERIDYSLPLHGPTPSLTFSWEDELEQAGAVTVKGEQIPYPLPSVDGELCDLEATSLEWTPGTITGVIASECASRIDHMVILQTVAGHRNVTERTVIEAQVTRVTGTVWVSAGGSQASAPFVVGGETRFSVPVATGEAVHGVTIEVDLEASLRIPIPPLTRLTHRAAWTQSLTRTVSLSCGEGASVSRTVRMYVYHPERVEAETVERSPIAGRRAENLPLASSVGAGAPFETLTLPEPEPEPPSAEQTPADGDLSDWFRILGWEWPW